MAELARPSFEEKAGGTGEERTAMASRLVDEQGGEDRSGTERMDAVLAFGVDDGHELAWRVVMARPRCERWRK